jgi:hypothetical protein
MFKRDHIKHFLLVVESLNTRLVEQLGSDPGSVANRVSTTLVSAIHILQARGEGRCLAGGGDGNGGDELFYY